MFGKKLTGSDSTTMRAMLVLLLPLSVAVLGACSEDGADITLPEDGVTLPETSEAPETTAAPETTTAPETTQAAPASEAEDDGSNAVLWIAAILAIVIIGLISYFGARSGSRNQQAQPAPVPAPPPPVAPAAWKQNAQSAYADARWLYDEMDVELASWRGDTLYEAQTADSSAGINTTHQSTWNQLPTRLSAARDALYQVEATANDQHVSQVATTLADNLSTTRSAVDRVADARRNRRAAEDGGSAASEIDAARSAESRAADELAADRRRLGDAVAGLSAVI